MTINLHSQARIEHSLSVGQTGRQKADGEPCSRPAKLPAIATKQQPINCKHTDPQNLANSFGLTAKATATAMANATKAIDSQLRKSGIAMKK